MNKVTKSSIEMLAQRDNGQCLTIYMPTHKISTPPTIQEDKIRYKNLIRDGAEKWREVADNDSIKASLAYLESLQDDEQFWQATVRGLAIFADKAGVEVYHLPIECEERVCVDDSFDLTPMYIVENLDTEFYVLALAMHNSKLYKGDAYGLEKVEIDFPSSPEDALNIDEMYANSNTQRGFEGAANSNYALSMHGAGDSSEAGREERLQYFRIIDAMVTDPKRVDTSLPMIIAATDSEAGDYKVHSKSHQVLEAFLPGNHTETELHELHDQAWRIIHEEVIDKKIHTTIERFDELKGVHRASSDLDEIREAVKNGKVDTLLLRMMPTTNDSVSETKVTNAPLIRFDEQYEKNRLQDIIEDTVAHGGKIVGVEPETFDIPALAGAVYRY